jgi:hypothetical protein
VTESPVGRPHHHRKRDSRKHVIAPVLAGIRSPRLGPKPAIWTPVDRDDEHLRTAMQTLFTDLAIDTSQAA